MFVEIFLLLDGIRCRHELAVLSQLTRGGAGPRYACCSLSVLDQATDAICRVLAAPRVAGEFCGLAMLLCSIRLRHWPRVERGYCVLLPPVLVGAERGVVGALAHWVPVRGAYETRALRPRFSARGGARSKAKDD